MRGVASAVTVDRPVFASILDCAPNPHSNYYVESYYTVGNGGTNLIWPVNRQSTHTRNYKTRPGAPPSTTTCAQSHPGRSRSIFVASLDSPCVEAAREESNFVPLKRFGGAAGRRLNQLATPSTARTNAATLTPVRA